MAALTIGRLAEAAGVNVETVRYYERRGLLVPPPRTASGYRQYGEADVWRLAFIRRAKDLGFTLAEVAGLLDDGPERSATVVQATAASRLAAVEAELEVLQRTRARLRALLELCADGDGGCLSLEAPALSGSAPGPDAAP